MQSDTIILSANWNIFGWKWQTKIHSSFDVPLYHFYFILFFILLILLIDPKIKNKPYNTENEITKTIKNLNKTKTKSQVNEHKEKINDKEY